MNYSVYRFTLNMHTHRSQASVSAFYGDTAVRLLINLTDGGMPYLIGDGCTAVLSGTKADGTKLWDRCVIVDGTTIQYDFTEQTSNCAGVANCEITLYDAEGKIVTAPKFTIVIDEREVKDDDIPISETETALLDKIAIDETAREKAEAERASAEENRVQAETKRAEDFADFIKEVEDAEAERASAEADRVLTEAARADAEAGRAEAETQRYNEFITLTSLVEGAETARVEAEEGRVQAEAKRAEEFTALKNAVEGAEAERVEAEQGRVQAEIDRQQIVEELQNGFSTLSENGTVITGLHLDSDPKAYKYTFQVRGCKFNKTDGAISVGAEENIGSPVEIDLPLESVVVSGRYDHTNKQVVLTLKGGSTVAFSVIDLVSGLVSSDTFSYSIALINTSLNTHSASITALENKHSQHGTRISGAEANITNHGKRISEAENKLTDHGKRMSDAESKLAEHTTQLTNHDTRIVEAESKIEEIEEDLINVTEGKVDKITPPQMNIQYAYCTANSYANGITHNLYQIHGEATPYSIAVRDQGGMLKVGDATADQYATTLKQLKEYTAPVAKIADHEKRIENLENTLLTFGEDDSVAYIKNAPGGSAPNVMLNSVGGRSKKSKNLLPYMQKGLRVMAAGEGKFHYIYPGNCKELINGCAVTFNNDGSVRLFAPEPTTVTTRVDFAYGDGGIKVEQDGVASYVPRGGLQLSGTYTFSANPSSDIQLTCSAHKFDSNASNFLGTIKSGYNSFTMNCTDIGCNNIHLVCIQLSPGTVIDTTVYPMLNEGDTALPFEINEGITESAVTEIKEMSEQLLDPSEIEVGYYEVDTGKLAPATAYRSFVIPLKSGEYTLSSDLKLVTLRKIIGSKVENYSGVTTPHTFTVENDGNFGFSLKLNNTADGNIADAKIMLNRGKEAMPYAEFGTVVDTFPIPSEIQSLPDYGKEFTYIDFDRKVFVDAGHDITLDGSSDEHWNIDPAGPYIYTQVTQYGHPAVDASNVHIATVCERFKDVLQSVTTVIPYESVRTLVSISSIYFRTKVASTLAQWKAYLASNPIKVRYRVAEPVETDISQYLTGYDKYKMLKVGSGDIVFHNEKKNEVPSTITYVKAKE